MARHKIIRLLAALFSYKSVIQPIKAFRAFSYRISFDSWADNTREWRITSSQFNFSTCRTFSKLVTNWFEEDMWEGKIMEMCGNVIFCELYRERELAMTSWEIIGKISVSETQSTGNPSNKRMIDGSKRASMATRQRFNLPGRIRLIVVDKLLMKFSCLSRQPFDGAAKTDLWDDHT